ncbi:MAG: tetratricopeptide repeat protein [Nitrospinota bacterium]
MGYYRNYLGEAFKAKGLYQKAIKNFEEAHNIFIKAYGPNHDDLSITWNNLGSMWKLTGNYNKSIKYYEKAYKLIFNTFGPAHPNLAGISSNLGGVWYLKRNYKKAIEYYEKALKIYEEKGDSNFALKMKTNIETIRKREGI